MIQCRLFQTGTHPRETTLKNIDRFRSQVCVLLHFTLYIGFLHHFLYNETFCLMFLLAPDCNCPWNFDCSSNLWVFHMTGNVNCQPQSPIIISGRSGYFFNFLIRVSLFRLAKLLTPALVILWRVLLILQVFVIFMYDLL